MPRNIIMRLALSSASGLLLMSCGSSDQESNQQQQTIHNVLVTTAQPQGASLRRDYAAMVQEPRSISAGFKTGGQIERTLVKEGDRVAQGQVLATLDASDIKLKVEQLTAKYEQLKAEMARKEKLYQAKNLSQNEYEASQSALRQLKADLDMQRNQLSYTRLLAPVSGYITKRVHERGEAVQPGTGVFELMDDSGLEVVVDIPAGEYVNRENFASFTGRSQLTGLQGTEIPLKLLSLTPKADNNQLYQLKLVPSSGTAKGLTPGMNLTVTIEQHKGGDNRGFTLPARAIFGDNAAPEKRFVWVVSPKDSVISRHQVQTLPTVNADRMTVTSGLEGGEIIVSAGVNALHDGEKVAIIPAESATNPGNLL